MTQRVLIIASKGDVAGTNITTCLSRKGTFDFHLVDGECIRTENLNHEKIARYDVLIFASRHVSQEGKKSLCVHAPGNLTEQVNGGEPGRVCKSSGLWFKQMYQHLVKSSREANLEDYEVTMEATHHGPHLNKPCLFVEIGSTETEWRDERVGEIVAEAISETIEHFEENPYNEVVIAIGGPHYCPNFNKLQKDSNLAIAHVIPKYALPLHQTILEEVLSKVEEELEFAVLDWKGIGDKEEREKLITLLEKNYVRWKKVSDIRYAAEEN